MHLPLTLLPALSGNKFYFHEVLGYQVIDKLEGEIGLIKQIFNYPNQDFIVIMKDEKEILIPINNEIISKVDRVNQLISVELPAGLLDIYL